MEISAIFMGALIFGASMIFVMLPLQKRTGKDTSRSREAPQPQARRESVLSALRALDFDFKTGKVSEEDYGTLRAQLLAEAAQLIQVEKEMDDELEVLIQSRKKTGHQLTCGSCGGNLQAGQHFCAQCGAEVKIGKCPDCGNPIQARDVFCTYCGQSLNLQVEGLGRP